MKHKQTFAILFWAYRGKQKENEATLYARVAVNGKRAEISLSKKIDVTRWDEDACIMKGKSPEALDVNEFIDLVKGELRQRYYELRATGQEITAEAIKNKYLGIQEEHCGDQDKYCSRYPEPGIVKWKNDLFGCENVELRGSDKDSYQSHNKSNHYHQKRFYQELIHQLKPRRANNFSYPYFTGTLLGSRCAQVHKIDTGKQYNKDTYNSKKPYILDESTRPDTVLPGGPQMPIVHRMKEELGLILPVLFRKIILDVPDLFTRQPHVCVVADLNIKLKGTVIPLTRVSGILNPGLCGYK
jgi:hypothetical protein